MSDAANETRWFHIRWISALWREKMGLIVVLFFLTLLSSAVAVTYPYLSKLLLDKVQALLEARTVSDPMADINRLLLVFAAVGLGGLIASSFPAIRGATNSVFEHAIRSKYFRKVLGKNHAFFAAFASGDIVTRLTDDLNDYPKLPWFLCSGIFRALEAISKVLFCIASMLLLDWRLTLFSLIPLPLMIGIFYYAEDKVYDTFQKNQEAISAINTRLEMSFSGVRIIKAYACEEKYKRFFNSVLATRWDTEMAVARLEIIIQLVYQYIEYVAQIGIVFAGGIMAVRGTITVGTFYAFYTYLSMLIYPILNIPQLFVSGKRAFVNIDRLEELACFPETSSPMDPKRIEHIDAIELADVSFAYDGRSAAALSGVSMRVGASERIAVIGPVGAGKSTLIKILLGLLSPRQGTVRVNGTDLAAVDMTSYRGKVTYVPQEALLFSGTLRENVEFGGSLYTSAVEAAQMKDEIESFKDKDATRVGQRGLSLSGGQKQRIAIARAIAAEPEFMLFDDITASLDAANEKRLMSKLDAMRDNLGFIIVSHRLSTLQYVDKVLFMDHGSVAGFGTHDELLSLPAYRDFVSESMQDKNGSPA